LYVSLLGSKGKGGSSLITREISQAVKLPEASNEKKKKKAFPTITQKGGSFHERENHKKPEDEIHTGRDEKASTKKNRGKLGRDITQTRRPQTLTSAKELFHRRRGAGVGEETRPCLGGGKGPEAHSYWASKKRIE